MINKCIKCGQFANNQHECKYALTKPKAKYMIFCERYKDNNKLKKDIITEFKLFSFSLKRYHGAGIAAELVILNVGIRLTIFTYTHEN